MLGRGARSARRALGDAAMTSELFGASQWFERVLAAAAPLLPEREALDARIQYDVADADTHHRWVQVFAGGRLQETRAGDLDAADVEIHWRRDDALAVLAGRI